MAAGPAATVGAAVDCAWLPAAAVVVVVVHRATGASPPTQGFPGRPFESSWVKRSPSQKHMFAQQNSP